MLFNLSYARLIKPDISSGLNVKYINQKIKSSSTGLAFDIGFLSKTAIKNLTAGLTFQNIGLFSNFKDELPFNIKLGCGYKPLNILTLAMDIDLPNDSDPKFHLGAEYLYPEIEGYEIALRTGFKTGVDTGKFNLGFGIKTGKYRFDYAYSSYDDLGDTHQLSFNLRFDKKSDESNRSDKFDESHLPQNKVEEVKEEVKVEAKKEVKEEVMEEIEEEVREEVKEEVKVEKTLDMSDMSDSSHMSYSTENKPEEVKAEPKAEKEVEKEAEKENDYYTTKAKVNLWR